VIVDDQAAVVAAPGAGLTGKIGTRIDTERGMDRVAFQPAPMTMASRRPSIG
jgi:hypothetical protein